MASSVNAQNANGPRWFSTSVNVGARIAPGLSPVAIWDADFYLDRGRMFSLGPGVGFSAFGGDGGRPGQQQDLLLSVDIVRAKYAVDGGGRTLRPVFYGGLGFSYAQLAAAAGAAAETDLSPMLTFGAGMDIFLGRNVAISALGQPHFHLSGSRRVPDVWAEIALGLRVGL